MDTSEMYRKAKETEKSIEKNFQEIESVGVRVLVAYQCIYCGEIVNEFSDLMPHLAGECRKDV